MARLTIRHRSTFATVYLDDELAPIVVGPFVCSPVCLSISLSLSIIQTPPLLLKLDLEGEPEAKMLRRHRLTLCFSNAPRCTYSFVCKRKHTHTHTQTYIQRTQTHKDIREQPRRLGFSA